jgi:hypothetical protein
MGVGGERGLEDGQEGWSSGKATGVFAFARNWWDESTGHFSEPNSAAESMHGLNDLHHSGDHSRAGTWERNTGRDSPGFKASH